MIPAQGSIIPRPDLGQAVTETLKDAPTQGFIAPVVMPAFFVSKQSATYPVIPARSLFNVPDTRRGPMGKYNRDFETFEFGFYATSENGLEMPIDDRHAAMYKSMFDYELTCANILMGKILRAYEVRVANKLFSSGAFPSYICSTPWTSTDTADPKKDIQNAIKTMRQGRGIVPNRLIISWNTFFNLTQVKKVQDAVANMFGDRQKTGTITIQHLEAYLEIQIEVAGALRNTAKKGQNVDLADIWTDSYALLARVAKEGDDITEPCIGRTFIWNEGAKEEIIVEEYYSDEVRGKILRVRHDTDEHFLKSIDENGNVQSKISYNCGTLLTNIKA